MSKTKRNYIISIVLIAIAVLYTFLVQVIDVKPIGPEGSDVGFATMNKAFADAIGSNETLYKLTQYLGYISLLMVGIYGIVGLAQLIKRKSLFKVDKEIIMLGIFYIVVLALYVFFEIYVVNYRPILIDNELEASFPSSHTVLAICVCGSAVIVNNKLFRDVKGIKIVNIFAILLLCATLIGRLFSGAHWLSDIIGGGIISIALLMTFCSLICSVKQTK